MFDIVKSGGSILTNSFHLYFLKLHSCNYTLPPLIKRRNRGVIFLFLHSLHSSPRYFWGKSSARVVKYCYSTINEVFVMGSSLLSAFLFLV